MRHPFLILLFSLFASCLLAQFGRVEVNTGNIPSIATIKRISDNGLAAVLDGELYQIGTSNGVDFAINKVENSIVGITDIQLHDIDLDGDDDVIVWKFENGKFEVYLNEQGNLVYRPEWSFGGKPHHLHAQDFDLDGVDDLMINHRVYLTKSPGEREQVLRYPLLNTYKYRYTQFMDHDQDGDMDVLLHQVHWLRVLVNDGDGTTVELLNLNETQNRVSWCRVINTNGGRRTLFYDRVDKIVKEVHFAGGGYTIRNLAPMSLNENYSDAFQVDLDSDGNEEIVVHSANNRDIVVVSYDPGNSTATVTTTDYSAGRLNAFGLFEFEGTVKLFGGNTSTFNVYSFDNEFKAQLESSTTIAIEGGGFGDLDGDGFVDVIANGLVKRYEGEARFDQIRPINYPATGGVLSDYDNDGDLDYVTPDQWFENTGNMMFGPAQDIVNNDPTPEPEIFFTKELLRADVDLDGDIDILTYNIFGEPLELLENNNNAFFEDPVTLATSGDISGDVVLIQVLDTDLDGDLDILFVAQSGIVLIKSSGPLEYDMPVKLYSGSRNGLSASISDINSDGLPDLIFGTRDIIAGTAIGEAMLYMGSEDIPSETILNSGNGYHRVAFADIDNEGWLDIVYQNSSGLYWLRTTNGTQFATTRIDASFLSNGVFRVTDVNSDGDDDIILYRNGDVNIYYYLNGETGSASGGCPAGDLYLRSQQQVNEFAQRHGSCTELPGNLHIGQPYATWSDISDLTPLTGLKKIGGTLNLYYNNSLQDLRGLDSLHTINGSFLVDGYKTSNFEGIEQLRTVGGDINFRNVATVGSLSTNLEGFSQIDSLGGGIIMRSSNVSSVTPLLRPVIHGDLIIENCRLTDTTGWSSIDSIYGELNVTGTELQSLSSLKEVRHVEGIVITDNEFLFQFDAFENITEMIGGVLIGNNYALVLNSGLDSLKRVGGEVNYSGPGCNIFENLEYVGGDFRLITKVIAEQSFNRLDSVGSFTLLTYQGEDLRQFSNLKHIAEHVNITNNSISTLYGFHNIKSELTSFDLASNRNLLHLDDLHDSLTVSGEVRLIHNTSLNYCNAALICNHLTMGRPLEISRNGQKCQAISDLRCANTGLSGFAFHDRDQNGIKGSNEAPLANIEIVFSTTQDTIVTAVDGFFITSASEGDSINITARLREDWEATTPLEIVIDSFIPGASSNVELAFGMKPQFNTREFDINYTSGLFLCDREFTLQADAFNTGTIPESCELEVRYPQYVTVVDTFSRFTTHDVDNRILTFRLDTLYPFLSKSIDIPFIAPGAEYLQEEFVSSVSLWAIKGIDRELLSQRQYEDSLLCSYDPNDKLVRTSNGGTDLELDSDEALIYTVRFQNTGNYFAENVRIIDTISPLLDLSSFEFLSTSHPVEIHRDGHVFIFDFNMINLPDSTRDFEASQGFVSFKINPISTMTPGIRISNDADIYFDFNPPILTNQVQTVVLEPSATRTPEYSELIFYPNPASDRVYLRELTGSSKLISYEVFSTMGTRVALGTDVGNGINISELDPGVYLIRIYEDAKEIGVGKVIRN